MLSAIADLLRHVGEGDLYEVRAQLAADPALVNKNGPHPFWGGEPQPLHVAVETTRRPMVDLLLEHGADVSGSNESYDHWSPLMLAIDRDQPEIRDELLRRGARVGLLEALMLGEDAKVETLLASGLPDMAPNRGSILAFARTPFAIDRLMALGADPAMKDRWGSTPVDAMSRLGRRGQPLVQHLIDRGVPAGPQEYARLGDRAALERLIDADPSVVTNDAVMIGAVDFGHHDLVEWLLSRGANVNARSDAESRHTALHSAAWNGDLQMVKLLLAAGADPDIHDEQHDGTPLGWADTARVITNNAACADVVSYLSR